MFDSDWYNSGDIVPDQVTPASDATPIVDGTATAGISTEYSREDHVHPLNIATTIPPSDSASGSVGSTNYYARYDHSHPLNITTSIPPQDSANGSVGTTNYYARNNHSYPVIVENNASNIPIVNGVGANGTLALYARQDHVHPQQLTYDGNITATKFIKAGGLTTEVLCANGDTKAISDIVSNYVDLTTNQTISGVKTFDSLKKTNDISAFQGNITNILTTDAQRSLLTRYRGINQLFPNTYGNVQINPSASNYDDGLRKARIVENIDGSSIFLGCSRSTNIGAIVNKWQIFTPPSNYVNNPLGFEITTASDSSDTTRGLQISTNGNTLTFNGNQFADLTTDQSIAGIKTFQVLVQVNPSINGTFNEGIRISRHTTNQWSNIQFCSDPNSNSGYIDNQWMIGTIGNNGQNQLDFTIVKAGQEGQTDRGLQISADGSSLTFNGRVL
ncbi:MAG: hypothetical protein EZS28_009098 [Streblomastix strix]|uniref:Uncharacterized protein n=1 Tax=Streblomastix strix TaxID=222440 RepID=A0A5J4WKM7_9EUKA|nr:MAG: hypothetical protein EZS28_009098 [Streblomastix strix]